MQFHVPQFLEVEDKLFGFLTLKQFLYLLGGISVSYLSYNYLKIYFALPIILIFLPFSFALAFVKINKQPFISMVDHFINYLMLPRLYIWKKILKRPGENRESGISGIGGENAAYVPPLSESKLKDLAWSLDIKEHQEEDAKPQTSRAPLLKDI